ncbi:MAG: nitrate/nitrite transporter [Anaerolineae bacterium]
MADENQRLQGLHYGWVILSMSVVTVLGCLGFARFGYTMILPHMKEGLGLTKTQAGNLATGNFVGYLILAIVGGFLAARYGPRVVISLSMLLIGVTMFLTGLAPSFQMALVWRTLTGVGSGGSNVPVMGLVSAWFGTRRRGLASGIAVGGSSVGLAITGPLIPRIIDAYGTDGWRYSWYYLGAMTVIIAILCFVILRDRPAEKGLAAIGLDESPLSSQDKPFGRAQDRASSLQWGLVYKSGAVWHLALIYIMFGFSYIIYATFFADYLTGEAGFAKEAAGWLWSLAGLVSFVSGFIWGTVSDVIGRKYGLALVYFLQGLCFIIFGLWKAPPGYYLSALLFALTAWSIPAIMAATSGDYLGPRLAPAALGFVTVFFGIGQAIGPTVAGYIGDVTGSYTLAFIIAGLAAFVGAGGALSLRPPREA